MFSGGDGQALKKNTIKGAAKTALDEEARLLLMTKKK